MKRMMVIFAALLAVTGSHTAADVPYYPFHHAREQEVWIRSGDERDQSWVNIAHRGRRAMRQRIRWLRLSKRLTWERICWSWMFS